MGIPKGWNLKTFTNRCVVMNRYRPYFPYDEDLQEGGHDPLESDELIILLDGVIQPRWRAQMKKDNKMSDNFSNVMEFRDYLT